MFQPNGSLTPTWAQFFVLLAAAVNAGPSIAVLGDHADDTAAASGGVAIGGLYRTGSALKVRVA
jgi:hypothetical protein